MTWLYNFTSEFIVDRKNHLSAVMTVSCEDSNVKLYARSTSDEILAPVNFRLPVFYGKQMKGLRSMI